MIYSAKVVALSGGIGGTKLALGLSRLLKPGQLTIIANTGDDFEHFGLSVCPDLDTLLYTLSGFNNSVTGWGRKDETWTFMQAMATLGSETWFNLGDGDLATHITRTQRLQQGETLTAVTSYLCACLGVEIRLLPMSDDPVRTMVQTNTSMGELPFQEYFVKHRCEPEVHGFRFAGSETAVANPEFLKILHDPELGAVIICPSNPFISIDPILSLHGVKSALQQCAAPVIAVSPIIGNTAVKGPTAKMMQELNMPVSATAVAEYYAGLLDGFVLDEEDAAQGQAMAVPTLVTETLMQSLDDREQLARTVLAFAAKLSDHE